MRRLILASASEGRKMILSQAGFDFSIYPSNFVEDLDSESDPYKLVSKLSAGKANTVAGKYKDAVVIGADTVVFCNGRILGKPKTKVEAGEMLKFLSGTTHLMITGLTVIDCSSKKTITKTSVTKIFFRDVSQEEINSYVAMDEPMTKAGGYAIQGEGGAFVEKIEGEYSGALGLPLNILREVLAELRVVPASLADSKGQF